MARTRRFASARSYLVYFHDVAMAAVSFLLSLYLRLGDDILNYSAAVLIDGTLVFTGTAALVFAAMPLYRGVWRYASLADVMMIVRATALLMLLFLAALFLVTRLEALPRSLPFINWLVLMLLLAGPRMAYRVAKDGRVDRLMERGRRTKQIPVLLIGAGDEAELFIRSVRRDAQSEYRAVGAVSHKGQRVGQRIHGVPVLGTLGELAAVVDRLRQQGDAPQRLVLTRAEHDGALVRDLMDQAGALNLTLARLPRLTDFRSGAEERVSMRPIALEDLLGRAPAALDRAPVRDLVTGRRVLITGAGGSIGGELARQVAALKPAHLTLADNGEFALYRIDLEIGRDHPDVPHAACLADVRDRRRISELFAEQKPDLVFHAAALKHVPLVEANPEEGVLTNAVGSRQVADACIAAGCRAMVLISTDKAVNPTSVMGATKRLAETYAQANDIDEPTTAFITVRFGNVLGSTGSVVPLFQEQLAAGGPLTITHPDMRRYFMSIREAVELVLQASANGVQARERGEPGGRIFVLDMGEPVKIVDLARQMIRLAGLEPERDIDIVFTGLRPGERLHEELFHSGEPLEPTDLPGVLRARPRLVTRSEIVTQFARIAELAQAGRRDDMLRLLQELVPEYKPAPATPVKQGTD